MLTFSNSAEGQPWLTGATWPGCALPQLKAPPRRHVERSEHREESGANLVGHRASESPHRPLQSKPAPLTRNDPHGRSMGGGVAG